MTVAPRTPGPAYAMEETAMGERMMGAAQLKGFDGWLIVSTTFAIWHELCERVKTPFAAPVISKSYAL
jgi:hypothetical protein